MIAVPAVDLKGGRCVQLVGGRPEDERISLPDPVAVARSWSERGFSSLHIVDLDAALGSGDNLDVIRDVLGAASSTDTQVGGGVRSEERADLLLEAGATRIIVGTRALDDRLWFTELVNRYPDRVTIALDTRGGVILRKGWTEETGLPVEAYLETLESLPLAGVLSTDVGQEGRLDGIDRSGCRRIIDASAHPVWISGGVTTVDDIAYLEDCGAFGVVLGMTIYTGTIDVHEVASRWGSDGRTTTSQGTGTS